MDARHRALIETPFYNTEGLMDARHKALKLPSTTHRD